MRAWLAFLVGCWTSSAPPPVAPPEPVVTASRLPAREPTHFELVLDKFAEFRDAMCTCTDRPCAERVSGDMTRWATEMADSDRGQLQPAETQEISVVAEELAKCMTRAFASP